jgi:hypothetical protein
MGDSRALQVRDFFFNRDVDIYNAGYSVINTADMQYFLEVQDISNIDVVLFALNHFSFNTNWCDVSYPTDNSYTEPAQSMNILSQMRYSIRSSMKIGKTIEVASLVDSNFVGLNAKFNRGGMLNDGSYYYGETYQEIDEGESIQKRLLDTIKSIENGNGRFVYGNQVNPNAVFYLKEFLQYCKDNGIYVICYAPPYAPTVNISMKAKGDSYAYQYELLKILPDVFRQYGFEFFDYTDASYLDCTDDYYIDGFHGSDVVFLRMFIDMIKHGSRLSDYCTLEYLQKYEESRFSNIRIFETWEQYNELTLQNSP